MFRHRNKGRNYVHNVQLAALLSIVAGIVNIIGVLALKTLTTNVTGHFAYFSESLFLHDFKLSYLSILYVLSFLLGAFLANTSMELTSKGSTHFSYVIPFSLEIFLLATVSLIPMAGNDRHLYLSCILLMAMGLQNALVTRISGSVVRTTHLTGLFTDLGIELSQLIFHRKSNNRMQLRRSILLKAIIIAGFFFGGLLGALLYPYFDQKTLLLPVAILLIALYYDRFLLNYYRFRRKLHDSHE